MTGTISSNTFFDRLNAINLTIDDWRRHMFPSLVMVPVAPGQNPILEFIRANQSKYLQPREFSSPVIMASEVESYDELARPMIDWESSVIERVMDVVPVNHRSRGVIYRFHRGIPSSSYSNGHVWKCFYDRPLAFWSMMALVWAPNRDVDDLPLLHVYRNDHRSGDLDVGDVDFNQL